MVDINSVAAWLNPPKDGRKSTEAGSSSTADRPVLILPSGTRPRSEGRPGCKQAARKCPHPLDFAEVLIAKCCSRSYGKSAVFNRYYHLDSPRLKQASSSHGRGSRICAANVPEEIWQVRPHPKRKPFVRRWASEGCEDGNPRFSGRRRT